MPNVPLDLPRQLDLAQFISDEAHDLRSPFNQIVGFSKLLLNNPSAAYPLEMQKEDTATVYRNGQRALMLLNGLIDIARLQRHEKELNPIELDLKSLLEQSISNWKKINPAAMFQPQYTIFTSITQFSADELFLRQILGSFITVVSQYIDSQGAVTLTVEDEPNGLIFKVTGTGKKIQPFSMLDLHMQGYLGRTMLELHQGEIRLAAETEDGAAIHFALTTKSASSG